MITSELNSTYAEWQTESERTDLESFTVLAISPLVSPDHPDYGRLTVWCPVCGRARPSPSHRRCPCGAFLVCRLCRPGQRQPSIPSGKRLERMRGPVWVMAEGWHEIKAGEGDGCRAA